MGMSEFYGQRDVEAEILPTLRELGIGFVPFHPLGLRFFTGTITHEDLASTDSCTNVYPRFAEGAFDKNLLVVERLKVIAERRG